jgi:hypothetical protein
MGMQPSPEYQVLEMPILPYPRVVLIMRQFRDDSSSNDSTRITCYARSTIVHWDGDGGMVETLFPSTSILNSVGL